jgi:hypothetical protein
VNLLVKKISMKKKWLELREGKRLAYQSVDLVVGYRVLAYHECGKKLQNSHRHERPLKK